jgi:hypothetical protein
VHLGVEDREALPVRGEDVGVGVLDLDDEALELEPAKVVAAAALGVGGGVGSEQSGDEDCWPSGNASLGQQYLRGFFSDSTTRCAVRRPRGDHAIGVQRYGIHRRQGLLTADECHAWARQNGSRALVPRPG